MGHGYDSKVWRHLKRYNPYSVYAAKSELKSEVSASYLTWIWWILDPVLFMLVYVFITVVVFRTEGEYLPVVVIIGLTVWNFFNKNVSISVKIVNTFKGIVHPDDWEWVSASISEQMERSDSDYVRYRIIRADGEVRWVDDVGHLVEDASGTRWFYATIMDATERVREKEELRRANERLEILTALSNDVLFDIECGTGKATCTAISRVASVARPSKRISW